MSNSTETLSGVCPKITTRTTLDGLISAISSVPKPQPPNLSIPAAANPAVVRCCQAYAHALKTATQQGKSRYSASSDAEKAYREAMPPLSGPSNIRDFVACVTHAMLIKAINGSEGTRLLYAAQVAHNIRLTHPKRQGKSIKYNNIEP
jgi:hypothetical protein